MPPVPLRLRVLGKSSTDTSRGEAASAWLHWYFVGSADMMWYYLISLADIINIIKTSWTCHEHIMNIWGIYHEYIMNISWIYHEHITKLQPTNSKDWPFSLGFSHDFRQDATTLRGEHAGAGGDLSELWECAGLRCHAWKCGPHEIWVEHRTSFVPKHQGFLKKHIFRRTKRHCLRLETTDSRIFLLIFSSFLLL